MHISQERQYALIKISINSDRSREFTLMQASDGKVDARPIFEFFGGRNAAWHCIKRRANITCVADAEIDVGRRRRHFNDNSDDGVALPGTRDPSTTSEPRLTRAFRNSLDLTYAGD